MFSTSFLALTVFFFPVFFGFFFWFGVDRLMGCCLLGVCVLCGWCFLGAFRGPVGVFLRSLRSFRMKTGACVGVVFGRLRARLRFLAWLEEAVCVVWFIS